MPIRPPALDDRGFDDLVQEVLARIPAHTPEWTNPRLGDPGRTLVELFAWLTDTLLYRANLIPERQRLAFLRLLGTAMNPAVPARGLVAITLDEPAPTTPASLAAGIGVTGPLPFETLGEVTVHPISCQAFVKRPLTDDEQAALVGVVQGLQQVYRIDGPATPYVTMPVFPGGAAVPDGFDVVAGSVDHALWLALLAGKPELVGPVRDTLCGKAAGVPPLLNVGIAPSVSVPSLFEDVGGTVSTALVWELSTPGDQPGEPPYVSLDIAADSTSGLSHAGVVRLVMPPVRLIGAPSNDVRANVDAGVGDRPPRVDDADLAGRLVAWLRLRPLVRVNHLSLSWVGVNAVEIDQRQTRTDQVIGVSNGTADQQMTLPGTSVEAATLDLRVDEPGLGFRPWRQTEDLALEDPDASAFELDPEAGTVRFGDGVRGRIPPLGMRVLAARMRAGGGLAGNLPAGTLQKLSNPVDLSGQSVTRTLKVAQPLATTGGDDAETLDQAEQRIPALLRHRDRAVTADDFRRLAADTPGVRLGRVEVLRRFKPQQRLLDVPGVVSVMVLPEKGVAQPPNPEPDRPTLEAVYAYLDARRLVGTELYVIGCEYVPVAVSVGVTVLDGYGRDAVLAAVRDALRQSLWPLPPGGPGASGWPLGRAVRDRELEVVAARVAGVDAVAPVNVFGWTGSRWAAVVPKAANGPAELPMLAWQLPELRAVVVAEGDTPGDLSGLPDPFGDGGTGVAVPVIPDLC